MPLQAGTRLGVYEILAQIGVGGMGEVYRARDTRLKRDVALKVLPDTFAQDTDRLARFQREAELLATLNHPHIAGIYGLEESNGVRALVLELVEGPTLADRIAKGPIPLDDALPIARQIAEALEAAHEQGVIHRDLKPANIKLRADGTVKVLDFGLAKAMEPASAISPSLTNSPTITTPAMMTGVGVILGTAAYMSPEQAKDKAVDRRADIWAFGCVLYEMLTGKMAFRGESVTDTLAAVIRADPDWSLLPAATPVRMRVLLQRCLQKDPKQRLRDIGDARISLDEVLAGAPDPSHAGAAGISGPFWRRVLPWAVAGSLAIGLAALAWVHLRTANAAPTAETTRFEIPLPGKTTLAFNGVFALSPDGRQLAFAASGSDHVQRVWVRRLDSLEARSLPGSEQPATAGLFFWSFDSRYVAFDAGGKLKKIDVSGGPAQTLCDIPAIAVGGSWNRDGDIIFGQVPGVIMRVSANGGPASPLTTLDRSRREFDHSFPLFLPDGRHFIYHRQSVDKPENSGVYVGSLDAKPEGQDSKRLLATTYGSVYVPSSDAGSGQLLFFRDGTLMAQPFDARGLELTGEAVTVAEQLGFFLGYGFFSSTNGVLVYRTGGGGVSQLTWFDRQGTVLGTAGEPGFYLALALSPDGARAAVTRYEQQAGNSAISLVDFSRGTSTRFTFGPNALSGIWSPDGSRIIFAAGSLSLPSGLHQKLASGVKDEEVLLESKENNLPTSWSRDGRFLLYMVTNPKGPKGDLWVLPLIGDKKPFAFLRTEFNNSDGQFSPDGHWVAYVSDESGRPEIYVRTFSPDSTAAASETGGKWLISTGGGNEPRWRGDGKELYYVAADRKLMAVEIATNPVFRAGVPKGLFQAPPSAGGNLVSSSWDVAADGKRFLFLAPPAQAGQAPFTVVQNWQAALKK